MGVPVYILTHEPPTDWPSDSTIHFVTELQRAVAQARAAADGKDTHLRYRVAGAGDSDAEATARRVAHPGRA